MGKTLFNASYWFYPLCFCNHWKAGINSFPVIIGFLLVPVEKMICLKSWTRPNLFPTHDFFSFPELESKERTVSMMIWCYVIVPSESCWFQLSDRSKDFWKVFGEAVKKQGKQKSFEIYRSFTWLEFFGSSWLHQIIDIW